MLYDNALLLRAYTHWWRLTGHPSAERVVGEIADFLLTDLRHAPRAASPRRWTRTPTASKASPTPDARPAQRVPRPRRRRRVRLSCFHVTADGTFEHGASTLQLLTDPPDPGQWAQLRQAAADDAGRSATAGPRRQGGHRLERTGHRRAGRGRRGLRRPDYLTAARRCAELLLGARTGATAGCVVRPAGGTAGTSLGVLEDYAGSGRRPARPAPGRRRPPLAPGRGRAAGASASSSSWTPTAGSGTPPRTAPRWCVGRGIRPTGPPVGQQRVGRCVARPTRH